MRGIFRRLLKRKTLGAAAAGRGLRILPPTLLCIKFIVIIQARSKIQFVAFQLDEDLYIGFKPRVDSWGRVISSICDHSAIFDSLFHNRYLGTKILFWCLGDR